MLVVVEAAVLPYLTWEEDLVLDDDSELVHTQLVAAVAVGEDHVLEEEVLEQWQDVAAAYGRNLEEEPIWTKEHQSLHEMSAAVGAPHFRWVDSWNCAWKRLLPPLEHDSSCWNWWVVVAVVAAAFVLVGQQ